MAIKHLIEREITSDVIGAFYEVYNQLGFGFLEFIYALALERELLKRGRTVGREVAVPVIYKGEVLANQRVDMIVDRQGHGRDQIDRTPTSQSPPLNTQLLERNTT